MTKLVSRIIEIIAAIIDITIPLWSIPREHPTEKEKQQAEEYEMPEMDAVSSSWMEARKIDMYASSLRKNQSRHSSDVILAGVLGAITPQTITFIVLVFGNSLISKHAGELISYMWLFTCLPAVFLGFVIGGLVSQLKKRSPVSRQVVIAAYFGGLICGLVLWALITYDAFS